MRIFVRYILVIFAATCVAQGQDKILTIDDILETVQEFNPDLKARSREIDASDGVLQQAALRQNPEFEIESVGGAENERSVILQQTVLTAGKRRKRIETASLQRDQAQLIYDIKFLEIVQGVKFSFIDVLVDQQTIVLLRQKVTFAKEFLEAAKKKVKSGGSSPAEEARATVFLASSRLEMIHKERVLEMDLQQLASFWGGHRYDFDTVIGTLDTLYGSVDLMALNSFIQQAPSVLLADGEIQIRESMLTLAKADRIPDISIGGSMTQLSQGQNYPSISLSLPLPLFNRNQGAITEAAAGKLQAFDEKEIVETQVTTEARMLAMSVQSAHEEALTLRDQIIPQAGAAYDTIRKGYLLGQVNYLEVMDAQTTLFNSHQTLVSALGEYHRSVAAFEGLLGVSFKTIVENSVSGE